MEKFIIYTFLFLSALLLCNSCKQCNKSQVVNTVVKDTLSIPKLEAVNAEIRKDSLNPYLYYKRAQVYETNGDLKSAATDMFLALSLDSVRPEFYLYTANLFKKTGDLKRGIALMDKAIVTDSLNTAFYVKAGELAFIDTSIKGNLKLALAYLNAAIDKNPQNADIYFYKGNVYKAMGDTVKAISSFQTATELNPKFYNAYVQLGLMLERRNDKNAEKYLDNAIKVSDKPEDALYAKANLLKEEAMAFQNTKQDAKSIEKFNSAIENFKKVVAVNYHNIEAYMGLGKCYYEMDSVEQAYKYYGLAAQLEPTYAGAYFSKGLCAEDLGKTKEAMSLYQNCLDVDPHFKRAEEHLKKLQGIAQ